LALPYRYVYWKKAVLKFEEMLEILKRKDIVYSTVHATMAKINDNNFLEWGQQTIKIAEDLGAKTITVHPNRVSKKNKAILQETECINLRHLQHKTPVGIAIETFTGHERIFTPDEIIQAKLPMTLDTSHIHNDDMIMCIIQKYWQYIPVVHLSARNNEEQHLPIDTFCIKTVRELVNLG